MILKTKQNKTTSHQTRNGRKTPQNAQEGAKKALVFHLLLTLRHAQAGKKAEAGCKLPECGSRASTHTEPLRQKLGDVLA